MKSILVALAGLVAAVTSGAEFPLIVAQALDRMPRELPADLGFTIEMTRGSTRTTESFDPARPAAARWTLLARDGREPTAEERAEYYRQRAASTEPGYRASFMPEQIDRSWAEVITESATHLTVRLRFSAAAAASDRLLGQLDVIVSVHKARAAIASHRLRLRAPYSPVLGVRMRSLDSGAEFDELGRPQRTWSRFEGRIFLRPVDERIEARYRDFVRIEPAEGAR